MKGAVPSIPGKTMQVENDHEPVDSMSIFLDNNGFRDIDGADIEPLNESGGQDPGTAARGIIRLAAGIAHNFNNLLLAIIGNADLALLRNQAGCPTRRELDQIMAAALRAASLTNQLLAFSGNQALFPKPTDLNALVGSLESRLRSLAGEKVGLEVRLARHLGEVNIDPERIGNAIVNLASHALDAMPDGGTLLIRTSDVGPEDDHMRRDLPAGSVTYLKLAISDTGPGMDRETASRIFEPFGTASEETAGLRLAAVQGIIRQSGGCIFADSSPGCGTTYVIFLPRRTS